MRASSTSSAVRWMRSPRRNFWLRGKRSTAGTQPQQEAVVRFERRPRTARAVLDGASGRQCNSFGRRIVAHGPCAPLSMRADRRLLPHARKRRRNRHGSNARAAGSRLAITSRTGVPIRCPWNPGRNDPKHVRPPCGQSGQEGGSPNTRACPRPFTFPRPQPASASGQVGTAAGALASRTRLLDRHGENPEKIDQGRSPWTPNTR